MKKKQALFTGLGVLIALSGILLLAFNHYSEAEVQNLSPEETITHVHELAKAGDIKATKAYMYSDILTVFENGQNWAGTYADFITDYSKKTDFVSPIKKTLEVNGNNATIDVMITYTDKSQETKKYVLIKEAGKWKIAN